MCIVSRQLAPRQVNVRASPPPPGQARAHGAAGQAPGRAGVYGAAPQLQQTKLSTRAGAAALVILEYGNMIRRIIDTECRQVCELQHTHTNTAQRGRLKSAQARPGAIEM